MFTNNLIQEIYNRQSATTSIISYHPWDSNLRWIYSFQIHDNKLPQFSHIQQTRVVRMGNDYSEFEIQFYQIYSFAQMVEDPHFGQVAIYRKSSQAYNLMMLYEINLSSLFPQEIRAVERSFKEFEERIKLAKYYQNVCTVCIDHYHIVPNNLDFSKSRLRIYAEYHNHTLHDYFTSLRTRKIYFMPQEVFYVMHRLIEAISLLRKMQICDFEVKTQTIFTSIEGDVMLSPLYFLVRSLKLQKDATTFIHLNKSFRKVTDGSFIFSLSNKSSQTETLLPDQKHLHNLKQIYLQLVMYMKSQQVQTVRSVYQSIETSKSLVQLRQKLPFCELEKLVVNRLFPQKEQRDVETLGIVLHKQFYHN